LPQPIPAPRLIERIRAKAAPRTVALALALVIEAILLFLLYSFGVQPPPKKKEEIITIVNLAPDAAPEAKPEPPRPQPKQVQPRPAPRQVSETPPPPVPVQPQPAPPSPIPPPPVAIKPTAPAAPPRLYGPPDTGAPKGSSFADSEVVGTAPNGETLYAAEWYRRPEQRALGAYLSTAQGPGWGLIACKTAPDYRVEDCVALSESPRGSQIARAVLAAAWEFRVRPPRLGGKSLVGAWVRIQIDYEIKRN
jgi:protein TonB